MQGHADDPGSSARPLLVFPCNGNAIEALDCLGSGYRMAGFIDDDVLKQGRVVCGHAVHGREALRDWAGAQVLAVPGSPASYRHRRAAIEGLGLESERFARVIHPAACISPWAHIGRNVLIMAGVVITSDAVIGDHVCILPNTVIHHGVRVGAFSLLGANVTLAGDVHVEDNAYIGSASQVMNGLRLGEGCLVGLGSTVIRDVAPGSTVAGSPARCLR